MQLPITIGLHRSRILDAVLLLSGMLTIAVLLLWPQIVAMRITGVVLTLAGLYLVRSRLVPTLSTLRMDSAGGISGAAGAGSEFRTLHALPGAIVHPWLTVARFQDEDARRHVMVATIDSMSPDDFRRFRVFLRWRVKFAVPAGDAG